LIFFLGFGALLADSFPLLMIGSEGKDWNKSQMK
jgi:hypothetical protein